MAMSSVDPAEQAGRVVFDALAAKATEQGIGLPPALQELFWEDQGVREQCIFAAQELARWILAQRYEIEEAETVKMERVGGGEA